MRKRLFTLFIPVVLGVSYIGWALQRPLPLIKPEYTVSQDESSEPTPEIAWSQYGQQALGVTGYGVVATKGEQKAVPMASVAKVMLALAVLDKKPLQLNQTGPNISVTSADAAIYQQYYSSGQSVVPVKVGVTITQYEALQALLIPSANNIATLLANWAFGSTEAYTKEANIYSKKLGMNNTYFADASGFSASTVSTASDLVLLGQAAMQNPVIAQIVNQKTATIPTAGIVKNYNLALGINGINGIKTGSSGDAGGCFLFSTDFKGTKLIAAIVGAPDRGTAVNDAPAVASSFIKSLQLDSVLPAGKTYINYKTPWGFVADAKIQKGVEIIDWVDTTHSIKTEAKDLRVGTSSGETVGQATFTYRGKTYSANVALANEISAPSIWWRLTHPSTK